jgi:hypothetical protein
LSYLAGVERFYKDIELMIGFRPSRYWKILWCFITPATILFIWTFSVSQLEPVTYGKYQYPIWAIVFGWMLGLCSLAPVPIVMIVSLCRMKEGTVWQRVKKLARPADNWGPARPEYRQEWLATMDVELHEPSGLFTCPSPVYNPKHKSSPSHTASACITMPEEKNLLSDSATTMATVLESRSNLGPSSEVTSMLCNWEKPEVSNC